MSLAYVIAVISSNGALMYVNYPTQVLAKSCKMIPTMVMGVLVAKKHYPIHKYLTVLAITVGISVFMFDRAVWCFFLCLLQLVVWQGEEIQKARNW